MRAASFEVALQPAALEKHFEHKCERLRLEKRILVLEAIH